MKSKPDKTKLKTDRDPQKIQETIKHKALL